MNTILMNGDTLPEVYHKALEALSADDSGEVTMIMKALKPMEEPMISLCGIFGPRELEQYRQEMLYGILDFEVERGNWHYTYHQRMERWKQGVIDELKRDPSSRRAVIAIRDNAKDMGSGDPACLQTLQYMIRGGKLHCWVMFRSNDAVKACFMNMFALVMLQKEFADALGVEVGSYTHIATSWHCYPQDREMLRSWVKQLQTRDCTARYVGGWDTPMAYEREAIKEMVYEQHKKYLAEKRCCANCCRDCKAIYDLNAHALCCIEENIRDISRRNPNITKAANESHKVKYALFKDGEVLIFDSEKEACKYLGVVKCSVASCYRKGYRCKGYRIAKMDGKEE